MHARVYESTPEPPIVCETTGDVVRWARSGRSVVVTVRDGAVDARFCDVAARDPRGEMLTPVYRRTAGGYRLDRPSSRRMADDVAAFLAGEREPRFRFEGFQTP